MSVCFNILSSL